MLAAACKSGRQSARRACCCAAASRGLPMRCVRCAAEAFERIEGLLLHSIASPLEAPRLCAAQWACALYPFGSPVARWICVLAAGDAKLEVREAGARGLRPPSKDKDRGSKTKDAETDKAGPGEHRQAPAQTTDGGTHSMRRGVRDDQTVPHPVASCPSGACHASQGHAGSRGLCHRGAMLWEVCRNRVRTRHGRLDVPGTRSFQPCSAAAGGQPAPSRPVGRCRGPSGACPCACCMLQLPQPAYHRRRAAAGSRGHGRVRHPAEALSRARRWLWGPGRPPPHLRKLPGPAGLPEELPGSCSRAAGAVGSCLGPAAG